MSDLTLRICNEGDYPALRRVADRDSKVVPGGRLLAAEANGEILAAISIGSGAVIADPFRRSGDAVELLRRRAAQLRRAHGPGGPRRLTRLQRGTGDPAAPAET
jgi:hypothetical protein